MFVSNVFLTFCDCYWYFYILWLLLLLLHFVIVTGTSTFCDYYGYIYSLWLLLVLVHFVIDIGTCTFCDCYYWYLWSVQVLIIISWQSVDETRVFGKKKTLLYSFHKWLTKQYLIWTSLVWDAKVGSRVNRQNLVGVPSFK